LGINWVNLRQRAITVVMQQIKKDDKEKIMQAIAKLRAARISAQKARLVADQIRGKHINEAIEILTFSQKKASGIILKLLNSAIANAENNEGADIDVLHIAEIQVGEGMTMKRFAARAKGRGNRILKRTSNIFIRVQEV
jgi:ribosomal protein L22